MNNSVFNSLSASNISASSAVIQNLTCQNMTVQNNSNSTFSNLVVSDTTNSNNVIATNQITTPALYIAQKNIGTSILADEANIATAQQDIVNLKTKTNNQSFANNQTTFSGVVSVQDLSLNTAIACNNTSISADELSMLDGISTSESIQAQINSKAAKASPTFTGILTAPVVVATTSLTTPTVNASYLQTTDTNNNMSRFFHQSGTCYLANTQPSSSTIISTRDASNNIVNSIACNSDGVTVSKLMCGQIVLNNTDALVCNGNVISAAEVSHLDGVSSNIQTQITNTNTAVATKAPINNASLTGMSAFQKFSVGNMVSHKNNFGYVANRTFCNPGVQTAVATYTLTDFGSKISISTPLSLRTTYTASATLGVSTTLSSATIDIYKNSVLWMGDVQLLNFTPVTLSFTTPAQSTALTVEVRLLNLLFSFQPSTTGYTQETYEVRLTPVLQTSYVCVGTYNAIQTVTCQSTTPTYSNEVTMISQLTSQPFDYYNHTISAPTWSQVSGNERLIAPNVTCNTLNNDVSNTNTINASTVNTTSINCTTISASAALSAPNLIIGWFSNYTQRSQLAVNCSIVNNSSGVYTVTSTVSCLGLLQLTSTALTTTVDLSSRNNTTGICVWTLRFYSYNSVNGTFSLTSPVGFSFTFF